jgi:hypothetical protein
MNLSRFVAAITIAAVAVCAQAQCLPGWILASTTTPQYGNPTMAYYPFIGRFILVAGQGNWQTLGWAGDHWDVLMSTGLEGTQYAYVTYDVGRQKMVAVGSYGQTWELNGLTWELRTTTAPWLRTDEASISYHAASGKTVLVSDESPGLWSWDGTTWTSVASGTPVNGDGLKLAYDDRREVIVTVRLLSSLPAETWEWNGASWTKRNVSTPAGILAYDLTYDKQRGKIVMHVTGSLFTRSTYEYDGNTWELRCDGCGPVATAAMSYDELTQRVHAVISGAGNAMWTWDGEEWTLLAPGHTGDTAIAYDQARGEHVVFGGQDGSGYLGATWTYAGGEWNFKSAEGPGPRVFHAMAYDAQRERTVLYGGTTWSEYFSDTWEWDGSTWHKQNVTGPRALYNMLMAYDPVRKVVVLHGGLTSVGQIHETWEYNGTSWTQRFPANRPNFGLGAMSYDPNVGAIIASTLPLNTTGIARQTWKWDGNNWTRLADGPTLIDGRTMTFDPVRNRTILVGATASGEGTQTWGFNGTTWSRITTNLQASIGGHVISYDPASASVILTGGGTQSSHEARGNRLRRLVGSTWVQDARSYPRSRYNALVTHDTVRDELVVFGGRIEGGTSDIGSDTWIHDENGWRIAAVFGMIPRTEGAYTFDSARGKVVMFGGSTGGSGITQQTSEWNGSYWLTVAESGPAARKGAAMAFDSVRNVSVMYPCGTSSLSRETWEWNGTAWTKKSTGAGHTGRTMPAMAYDPVRKVTVLFGGEDANGYCSDTWTWNGTTWTQKNVTGPSPRRFAHMAWDAENQRLLLFGGYDDTALNDVWAWNGTAWSLVNDAGPAVHYTLGGTYDSQNRVLRVLTGSNESSLQVWEWKLAAPTISYEPRDTMQCQSKPLHAVAGAVGTSTLTYQWYKDSAALSDDGRIRGSGTPHLEIHPAYPSDTGTYRCVATDSCGVATTRDASLIVCLSDFDCSGFVDTEDYDAFVAAFENGGDEADVDRSGFVDIEDFAAFVTAFEVGC